MKSIYLSNRRFTLNAGHLHWGVFFVPANHGCLSKDLRELPDLRTTRSAREAEGGKSGRVLGTTGTPCDMPYVPGVAIYMRLTCPHESLDILTGCLTIPRKKRE